MEKLPEELLPVLEHNSSAFVKAAGLAVVEQVGRKVTSMFAAFVHSESVNFEIK